MEELPVIRKELGAGDFSTRSMSDSAICTKPLARRTLPRVRKSAVMED